MSTSDPEEALRVLMVPLRKKIENGQAFKREEVFELLSIVSKHGRDTQDIRFIDAITYFGELGFYLD